MNLQAGKRYVREDGTISGRLLLVVAHDSKYIFFDTEANRRYTALGDPEPIWTKDRELDRGMGLYREHQETEQEGQQ